mgnify:CR=1 FL=1
MTEITLPNKEVVSINVLPKSINCSKYSITNCQYNTSFADVSVQNVMVNNVDSGKTEFKRNEVIDILKNYTDFKIYLKTVKTL